MGNYKVEISGCNTGELGSLSSEEMRKLFSVMDKDPCARDILIEGNLKLVLSVLKRFYYKAQNMDDLFQVGCVGLIKATDHFDLSYDVAFSTYAVPMILGEIRRFIRDNNSMRISRSLKDLSYRANKMIQESALEEGEGVSYLELAQKLGVDLYDLSLALSSMREPVSMYEPIYHDGGDTIYLYDQIEDERVNPDFSSPLAIHEAIQELDQREQFLLDERFVMGKTQMEVAEELNISQAQVSRLEKKAVKELKKVLN